MSNNYHSGFVSIVGRTNVGKSTLLNQLLGEKLSIVSDKPQTTRNRIQCILSIDEGQAVFIDTPGLHKPKTELGERMNRYASETLADVDLILFVTTADSQEIGAGDKLIIERLKQIKVPIFLVLNKSDLSSAEQCSRLALLYKEAFQPIEIHAISALTGEAVRELSESIIQALPLGDQYYPDDMVTDQTERFVAAEIVREKVMLLMRDEIPHGVAVVVESFKEKENDLLVIEAMIYVDRESPKRMIIGSKGNMLKQIGSLARQELEAFFGCRVFLDLRVKVSEGWRNNERALREFGYQKR